MGALPQRSLARSQTAPRDVDIPMTSYAVHEQGLLPLFALQLMLPGAVGGTWRNASAQGELTISLPPSAAPASTIPCGTQVLGPTVIPSGTPGSSSTRMVTCPRRRQPGRAPDCGPVRRCVLPCSPRRWTL